MRRVLSLIVVACAVAAWPADARAELTTFGTTSGNILCGYWSDTPRALRCDLRQIDNAEPPHPSWCEFDWGRYFGLSPTGKGRRLCVSDAIGRRPDRVLRYGQTFKRGGYTCVSRTVHLRCTNRRGHGFELSRARQRLF